MSEKKSTYCTCLYYSANALARIISKMAEEEFAVSGLSPSHAFLVMTVNREPGIKPTEISEIMQLTPSTVTRLIEKLEYKGLVERQSNGKYTEVYATPDGTKLNEVILKSWRNLLDRYNSVLGEEAAAELTSMIHEASQKLDGK